MKKIIYIFYILFIFTSRFLYAKDEANLFFVPINPKERIQIIPESAKNQIRHEKSKGLFFRSMHDKNLPPKKVVEDFSKSPPKPKKKIKVTEVHLKSQTIYGYGLSPSIPFDSIVIDEINHSQN